MTYTFYTMMAGLKLSPVVLGHAEFVPPTLFLSCFGVNSAFTRSQHQIAPTINTAIKS